MQFMKKERLWIALSAGACVTIAGFLLMQIAIKYLPLPQASGIYNPSRSLSQAFFTNIPIYFLAFGLFGAIFKNHRFIYLTGIELGAFLLIGISYIFTLLGADHLLLMIYLLFMIIPLAIAFLVINIPYLFFAKNEKRRLFAIRIIFILACLIFIGTTINAYEMGVSGYQISLF
jgi:hypothetical protein